MDLRCRVVSVPQVTHANWIMANKMKIKENVFWFSRSREEAVSGNTFEELGSMNWFVCVNRYTHPHTHIPTESSWLSYKPIGGMSVKLSKSGLTPNCNFLLLVKWNLDPSYVFVKYFFLILKLDPISDSIKIRVRCATYFEYTRYALNLNFRGNTVRLCWL